MNPILIIGIGTYPVQVLQRTFKGRLWLLYRVCTGTEPKTRIHMQERTCLIFLQISTSSKFDLVSWTYICGNQAPMRRVVMGSYWWVYCYRKCQAIQPVYLCKLGFISRIVGVLVPGTKIVFIYYQAVIKYLYIVLVFYRGVHSLNILAQVFFRPNQKAISKNSIYHIM